MGSTGTKSNGVRTGRFQLPLFFRLTSLILGQLWNCTGASNDTTRIKSKGTKPQHTTIKHEPWMLWGASVWQWCSIAVVCEVPVTYLCANLQTTPYHHTVSSLQQLLKQLHNMLSSNWLQLIIAKTRATALEKPQPLNENNSTPTICTPIQ